MTGPIDKILRRIGATRDVMRLGSNTSSRARLALLASVKGVLRRIGWDRPVRVDVAVMGQVFNVTIGTAADFFVLREILLHGEYDCAIDPEPGTIVDIGSNIGASVLFFRARYPNAHIHAIEANPDVFRRLCQNTASLANVTPHHFAICDREGEIQINLNPRRPASSSLYDRGMLTNSVTVPAMTLDGFLERNSIERVDLLKFDIEGAEFDVFGGFRSLDLVRHAIGEFHLDIPSKTLDDAWKLFPGFSHRVRRDTGTRLVVEFERPRIEGEPTR